jgi:transaldolase/glucose-6-phosphate isomerase
MVEEGLSGVTSNPSIFEKAIGGGTDYDQALKSFASKGISDPKALYELLAVEDIQLAADVLKPVYRSTDGLDGYVSLEVSPHLAHDTEGTVQEARRLFETVNRPNVMIKVPGTPEGVPALTRLIAEGINVNVTLLFAVDAYKKVAEGFLSGIERLISSGGNPTRVASVASFFLSRIDTVADDRISKALDSERDPKRRAALKSLLGRVAIANAKVAYAEFDAISQGSRWKALAAKGARPQRLLWASTSTKNPKYPKLMYVEELIGPQTVNTMPAETYREFKKNGRVRPTLKEGLAQAQQTIKAMEEVGISPKEITGLLLDQGIQLFAKSFDKLLQVIVQKLESVTQPAPPKYAPAAAPEALAVGVGKQSFTLGEHQKAVVAAFKDWAESGKVRRLWERDTSLWTGDAEDRWMGWLEVVDRQHEHIGPVARMAEDVRQAGFRQVLLLGMGGSSLCPWVLRQIFGQKSGWPDLVVLDSTVPAQIRRAEHQLDLRKTLFIVSSKSGGTTEPNVLMRYFMDRLRQSGVVEPGQQFVAITDPGSSLQQAAKAQRFKAIFFGDPSIGGRYSALANFGMVPGALMGLDLAGFLERAEVMVQACASCCPPEVNPGVTLGLILGTLAALHRDKVTFLASPRFASLGAWLEQLIAESTGKHGTGLVPIDEERLGPPEVYGADRVFVSIQGTDGRSREDQSGIAALERAGHPVVRIEVEDPMDLGQEFFRWEIATAVAGSVLKINPFDQPDVEASKEATRRFLQQYQGSGGRAESPLAAERGIQLFADDRNAESLRSAGGKTVESFLAAHLGTLRAGDYFAIQAFLEMSAETHSPLQEIRHLVRDRRGVATTLGYGPRFLHSTGQLHKGGPNSGVFLQIVAEEREDLPIPGEAYSFGTLVRAQAEGDFAILAQRGRRLLRVQLGADVQAGLARLREMLKSSLESSGKRR